MTEHEAEFGPTAPTTAQSHSWVAQPDDPVLTATQGAHAMSAWH
jgi:hypothetical protein